MNYIGENIRFLRKQKNLTQADLAKQLGVNRSLIGAYEEGRSEPRIATLQVMAHIFKVGLGQLIEQKLDQNLKSEYAGGQLRILPVSVDSMGEELISLIPQKAAAGYTKGYADTEYIEQLRTANLPFPELQHNGTMRIFQIEGDSMLPVQPGSYIIGEFLEDWKNIKNNQCYILLTLNDGIVYKRLENEINRQQRLLLKSDNTEYKPYYLPVEEVIEVWQAKGIVSFDVPHERALNDLNNQRLMQMMDEMRAEIKALHKKVEGK